jgi:hypothetical protein
LIVESIFIRYAHQRMAKPDLAVTPNASAVWSATRHGVDLPFDVAFSDTSVGKAQNPANNTHASGSPF